VLPYSLTVDECRSLILTANMLGALGNTLAKWDGSYRQGLCAERCEQAALGIRHALSGLDIFLGDEAAAVALAPPKGTR
jgi:hypothetical protein